MITYEWEIRGLGVIRRCVAPGKPDEYKAIPHRELPDEWKRAVAEKAMRDYANSVPTNI